MCSTGADITEAAIQSVFNTNKHGRINLNRVSIRGTLCDVNITNRLNVQNMCSEFLIQIEQNYTPTPALLNFRRISQNYRYMCHSAAGVLTCIKSLQSVDGILTSGAAHTFRESLIGYVSGNRPIDDVYPAWSAATCPTTQMVGTDISFGADVGNKQIIVPYITINGCAYHVSIQMTYDKIDEDNYLGAFVLNIVSANNAGDILSYRYSGLPELLESLLRVYSHNSMIIIESNTMTDARNCLRAFCESV